jgi:hypothetical protein
MKEKELFELDSIEINKLPVYDITGAEVIEEVEDVELIFNYHNPESLIEIDRIRVCIREMSPEVKEAYRIFIASAKANIVDLIRKEF